MTTTNAPAQSSPPRLGAVAARLGDNIRTNLPQWCRALAQPPRASLPGWSASAIVAAIAVLAVTVAAMFFLDIPASDWARGLPQWFRGAFEHITNSGLGGWLLVPFSFIILSLGAITSAALPRLTQGVFVALAARFGFLFLAIGGPGLFGTTVKRLIGRARPYVDAHDNPFTYRPFVWRSEYASLPSGHATTAVAAAIAIGALWPRTRWLMWIYALVVMFSRVVVMSHHPSDVLAGALVGAIGADLVRRLFAARRLVFSPRDLSVLPGPSWTRIKAAFRQVRFGL